MSLIFLYRFHAHSSVFSQYFIYSAATIFTTMFIDINFVFITLIFKISCEIFSGRAYGGKVTDITGLDVSFVPTVCRSLCQGSNVEGTPCACPPGDPVQT